MIRYLSLVVLAVLVGAGCETIQPVASQAALAVKLYREPQNPPQAFEEVQLVTDEGRLSEQGDIEMRFRNKAARMGGDAIIMAEPKKIGQEFTGTGLADSYLYTARVIRYKR